LDALAANFRIHLLRLPGFEGAEVDSGIRRVDELASVLKVAMRDAGLLGLPLIGQSFGGWLAAELALIAPPSRLVLVAPLGLRIKGETRTDLFDRPREDVLNLVYADMANAPTNWSTPTDRRNVGSLARFAWNPYLCDLSLETRVQAMGSPTLVLWGDSDQVVPSTHGAMFADLIPDARLELITGAGHDPLSDQPVAFAALAGEFLTQKES
jgi:pimeloyl-ACP methyl ester carboxylesterase